MAVKKELLIVSKKYKSGGGFTLIELLVALAVFAFLVGTISGILLLGLRAQQRILTTQALLDQTSYALEYISRSLRMAKKETGGGCLSKTGLNYEIPSKYRIEGENLGRGLRFINHLEGDDCQEFFLEDNILKYKKKILGTPETFNLTSASSQIISLKFNLSGQDQEDTLQPRVTIFLDIEGTGIRPEEKPKLQLQTTISQRNPDLRY